jgi:hypothetical protein
MLEGGIILGCSIRTWEITTVAGQSGIDRAGIEVISRSRLVGGSSKGILVLEILVPGVGDEVASTGNRTGGTETTSGGILALV